MKPSDLSADRIRQALRDRGLDGTRKDGSEARIEMRARLIVYEYRDGQFGREIEARCRDVSSNGIGLVTRNRMAVGKRLVILFSRDNGSALALMFRVAGCEPLGSGLLVVNAELVGGMTATVVDSIHKGLAARAGQEPAAPIILPEYPPSGPRQLPADVVERVRNAILE